MYEAPKTCYIDGCGDKINSYGLCQKHYTRLKKNGSPYKVKKIVGGICKVDGCEEKNRNKGYCRKHYQQTEESKEYHRIHSAKRRALKAALKINDLSTDDWNEILLSFYNSCAYCGESKKMQQDHVVPITKGGNHTKTNVVPACVNCNTSKNNRDMSVWYIKQPFYSKEREDKIVEWLGR